ncbi:MAG: 2Fe-2S iron-sulfur cluster-binding protein [Pyrinomonadaceae bacterium]
MIDEDVFHPFEKLVEIVVLGKSHQVPEKNSILRGLQFLNKEEISYGDFCWNGECINCQVWIRNGNKEKMVMACRTDVSEGMEIIKLGEAIESVLEDSH